VMSSKLVKSGWCRICNAPIYSEKAFYATIAPPPIYTCNCFGETSSPEKVQEAKALGRLDGSVPPEGHTFPPRKTFGGLSMTGLKSWLGLASSRTESDGA
jgi:hypothetical protein